MEKISFCIPCYNSSKTIGAVISEIQEVMLKDEKEYDYEIITVVDGSPDNVFEVLKNIARNNKRVKVVNLSQNYSQANARMATLKYASGEYLVCLDDDGQCPMQRFWELFEPIRLGKDVSIAKYPHKKQSLIKNIGSKLNKLMVKLVLDTPRNFTMSNFFIMRKYVAKEIVNYNNPYPYMTGLLLRTTNSFEYVLMEDRERLSGTTGYTFRKLLSLWLNGFTNFSVRPLRISGLFGAGSACIGILMGIIVVMRKLLQNNIDSGWTSIISIMLFIGGLNMIMLGMVGEYIGRMFICINKSPQYVVKEMINLDEKNDKEI